MVSTMNKSIALYETFDSTTLDVPLNTDKRDPIISDRSMFFINIYVLFVLGGSIAVFGTVNNVFNMLIFQKLGLNDSMSIGLMTLSVTDFLISLLSIVRAAFFIWDYASPDFYLNPRGIHYVSLGWVRDILFLCSSWITTFLSIERCFCVVFPFKVRSIFTKTISVISMALIYIINFGAHIPIFATQWLEWVKVTQIVGNNTIFMDRIVVKFSKNRSQFQFYIDIVNGTILPAPAQGMVLVSVVWMVYGLRRASLLRKAMTKENANKGSNQSNLSPKEIRLVKVVLFLALILILSNIPRFIAVNAKHLFPQVSHGNRYKNIWLIAFTFVKINSSINMLVYLTVNTSYRQTFVEVMFGKKKS